MIMSKNDRDFHYDPEYTYKKKDVTIQKVGDSYPIIERTNNGLLFPEGPKTFVDMEQFKPGH